MRWMVAKAKTKKQEDTKLIVEFKWLWYPHTPTKGQYYIPLQGLEDMH